MATAIYHRFQADLLLKLADTTRDSERAVALRRLAAQHIAAADDIDARGSTDKDKQ
jgi:hypothetical protein